MAEDDRIIRIEARDLRVNREIYLDTKGKSMKKIASLVLAFIVAAMLTVTTAFADGTTVYVEDVGAGAGEEVIVDVIISGNTGFAAAKVELNYDSSVLTLKGITTGLLTGGAVNHEKGIVSFASAMDVTGNGVLLSAIFVVAEDAPDCVTTVSVNVPRLANTSSESLSPAIYSGSVSVTALHVHSYTEADTTAPTCEGQGYTTYKCECGHSYRDNYVSALGHRYSSTGTTAPTCTEKGSTRYACSVCGASYRGNYVDALGHKYTKPVFNWSEDYATCSASYNCTTCSEKFTEKCHVTSKTTPATTTAKGKIEYTATFMLDGQTYTDIKTVELPKLEPQPGASSFNFPVLYLIVALVAVAGIAVLLFFYWKKKKDTEGKRVETESKPKNEE